MLILHIFTIPGPSYGHCDCMRWDGLSVGRQIMSKPKCQIFQFFFYFLTYILYIVVNECMNGNPVFGLIAFQK